MLKKITGETILYFVIFSIILILLIPGGIVYYKYEDHEIRKSAYNELKVISDLKTDQIITWQKEIINTTVLFVNDPFIIDALKYLEINPANIEIKKKLIKWFDMRMESHGYQGIFLIDINKTIKYSSRSNYKYIDDNIKYLISKSFKENKFIMSDFYRSKTGGKILLDYLMPFRYGNNTPFIILFRIDPELYLYPLIQSWPIPANTSETLLIKKENDHVLYLNELKHQKNTALNLKIPLSEDKLPAANAILGKTGFFEGYDYRKKPVISYIRSVPDTSWFIVAKIDTAEILSELYYRFAVIIIIDVLCIAFSGVLLIYLFNSKQKKIFKKLYNVELEKKALITHFEYLTKYANDIILLADSDSKIFEANNSALSAYQYSSKEILTLSLNDLAELKTDILITGNKDENIYETCQKRKDGSVFPVEVSQRKIEIEGKTYIHQIIRDVTERKKSEELIKSALREKEKLLAELEVKNKEMENIIYAVSHDLKSPLINFIGFTKELENAAKYLIKEIGSIDINEEEYNRIILLVKESIMESIGYLNMSSVKMESLINSLLLVAKAGKQPLVVKYLDMNAIIKSILSILSYQIKQVNANIEVDDLPDCYGDNDQINRLFYNIIDNAIKYRDQKKRLDIKIKADSNENNIIYIVSDNGKGIPKENHNKIWELFKRLDLQQDIEGEGIGLTIALSIVKKHSGEIWLESEPGKGSTFYISLPKKIETLY